MGAKPVDATDRLGKGAGYLIVGLIGLIGGGVFLFDLIPSLRFLLAHGARPPVTSVDLRSTTLQRTSIHGVLRVTGYVVQVLARDYQAGPTDRFRSARFFYATLSGSPTGQPVVLAALDQTMLGHLGYFPAQHSTDPWIAAPRTGDLVTIEGLTGYWSQPEEITDHLATPPSLYLIQDTPPRWRGTGLAAGGFAILTICGAWLCAKALRLLRGNIL